MNHKLRIIAGDWRSRELPFADVAGLRPTPSRVRETLFNWLRNDIAGARCLDLFAGSGALGFEAASRGAAAVVLVDSSPTVCAMLRQNASRLKAQRVEINQTDTIDFLSRPPQRDFDVVFIDPPFRQGLIPGCCLHLQQNDWLARNAKIYIESEAGATLSGLPGNWAVVRNKTAGEVGYHLYSSSGPE